MGKKGWKDGVVIEGKICVLVFAGGGMGIVENCGTPSS